MSLSNGAGEYEIEFEATAGTARKKLTSGMVAYIGTGSHTITVSDPLKAQHCVKCS